MSRYIERAENIARFIDVNLNLCLDRAAGVQEQWLPLVRVTGDAEAFAQRYDEPSRINVMRFLTLDLTYPNSIASCVAASRENARTVRDAITSEMWQQINALHIMVSRGADSATWEDRPQAFYTTVKTGSLLFAGITDATLSHGTGWDFARLGRLIERADKTSRILDVKYFLLLPRADDVGGPLDVVHWAALLRSAGALEMYRQKHGAITPAKVVEFLALDPAFPRSLNYCLGAAEVSLAKIATPDNPSAAPVMRQLGRLRSELQYTDIEEIVAAGVHEYIDRFQSKLNAIDMALDHAFFQFDFSQASAQAAHAGAVQ